MTEIMKLDKFFKITMTNIFKHLKENINKMVREMEDGKNNKMEYAVYSTQNTILEVKKSQNGLNNHLVSQE